MYCKKCGMQLVDAATKCANCGMVLENSKDFMTYDYIMKEISSDKVSICVDCYESLGWEVTANNSVFGYMNQLVFKRDRKIKNKQALLKIQKKFDENFDNIEKMEKSKTTKGFVSSMIIGVIGALTLGGGMSLCLLNNPLPLMIIGIAIGVVGLGICALSYPLYTKITNKRNTIITPIIEEHYDIIANLCEEGNNLLK